MDFLRPSLLILVFALAGCGDDDVLADAGGGDDAATTDSGRSDAPASDAGDEDDAAVDDAAVEDAVVEDGGSDDGGAADAGEDAAIADAGDDAPAMTCTDSDDCGGLPCFLFPDGTSDCVDDPGDAPRTRCDGTLGGCECMTDAECTDGAGGVCAAFTYRYCGGAPPPETNRCIYSECRADSDCDAQPTGACLPRGINGFTNSCAYGICRTSADCRDGGTCDIYDEGCGPEGGVLFCRYADDVCSDDRPCRGARPEKCVPNEDGHGTQCVPDLPRP